MLSLESLKRTFNAAIEAKLYVGIVVRICENDGYYDEIIINRPDSIERKLDYIMGAYDENLKHKYAPISIELAIPGKTAMEVMFRLDATMGYSTLDAYGVQL